MSLESLHVFVWSHLLVASPKAVALHHIQFFAAKKTIQERKKNLLNALNGFPKQICHFLCEKVCTAVGDGGLN